MDNIEQINWIRSKLTEYKIPFHAGPGDNQIVLEMGENSPDVCIVHDRGLYGQVEGYDPQNDEVTKYLNFKQIFAWLCAKYYAWKLIH